MKRTISAEVGKGSVNHNSRKFRAENVDGSRTDRNIDYCNERIQTVYHQLFDEALKRYNEKQTRADRRILNYYEKIRSGNQEKPFHEIILQIGNKDDMSATGVYAELARTLLDEYIKAFRSAIPTSGCFRHISIWTRPRHTSTLTLCRSPPGASEGLIPVYR